MTAQAIMSGNAMAVLPENTGQGLLKKYGMQKERNSSDFLETVSRMETRSENRMKPQNMQRKNAGELRSFAETESYSSSSVNDIRPEKMPEENVTEEVVESLYTAVANIVNYLAEELSVTTEELTESLSELSLSFEDLTKPEGIVRFIVGTEFEGDPVNALNDPDFPEVIQEILEYTGEQMEIFEENNIPAEEVFREIAENGSALADKAETEDVNVYAKTQLLNGTGPADRQTVPESVSEEEIIIEEDNELLPDIGFAAIKEGVDESESTSSENSGGAFEKDVSSNLLKETSKQETSGHGKITMGQFIENLVQAAQAKENTASAAEQVSFRDVAFQVIEQVKVTNFTGETRLSMMLSPESLGRVEMMISTKEGVMTASLTTETQAAKEALESQMVTLKENLETQGIKVETIEVNVSDFHFEDGDRAKENGERKKGGKKNFISFDEEDGIMNETRIQDTLLEQVFIENGSTVSYRA